MVSYRILLWIFLLGLSLCPLAYGQLPTREDETAQRLLSLEEQIELDRRRLSDASYAEETSMEALNQIDREIALREELARTYRLRLQQLSFASDSLRISLAALQEDVERLKAQYRTRAVHAYTYGRLHDLALILASSSINQMLIRARYLQRFGEQRERKLASLASMSQSLKARQDELLAMRQQTEELLAKVEEEEHSLIELKRDRQQLIARLRNQRADIERELRRKQAQQQALESMMRRLTAAGSKQPASDVSARPDAGTPYVELTGTFSHNKGRLPWPSEGVVQEPFGDVVNPVYGTTTSNPGILIATRSGADVRAVFDGDVMLVDVMPDFGTIVTIDHGEYKSVYSNFSMLYVHAGDHVRAGQIIGKAGTRNDPKGEGIFFGLFKNGAPIDPVPWFNAR